ncbi:MAG: WD40/YVTN/BNR-like repeat-containing protein [Stenotrophobium sp.]
MRHGRRRLTTAAALFAAALAVPNAWAQDNAQPALAAASGEPAAPADAGQPRPALMAPLASRSTLVSITRAGAHLVAVGHEGVIVISPDGRQWTQVASPVSDMLDRVRFFDANNGWILGYDGAILQTVDGGNHWTLRNYKLGAHPLYDLLFLDAQHAIAIGGFGDYLISSDGGKTWAPQQNPLSNLGMHMNAIVRLGDGSLLIAGERGLTARSKDNGANWELLDSPYTGSFFGALPLGEHGVLVYGLRGTVFTLADVAHCPTLAFDKWDVFTRKDTVDPAGIAALGWKKLQNPVVESLFGGQWLANAEALLVGVNGTVVETHLASGTLTQLKTPAAETLGDVLVQNGRMIAVGRLGAQDIGAAP